MPMTLPSALTSGPPESPGWIGASTWISPSSCSGLPPPSSVAVMVWSTAVTEPTATAGVPPLPNAFPRARTSSPTDTLADAPVEIVASPDAPCIWSTATSPVTS